jgi:hypothetical protein
MEMTFTEVMDELLDREPTGPELLDEVHAAYTRYVVFPSQEAADAVTLYTAATHAQTAWEHATRLVVKSPIKRCGKTRLQEVMKRLAHQVLSTANISAAALVRSINETDPPTLILDEADTVWGKKDQRIESAEDLRGILNAGHSRGWPYIRWDPKAREREECSTFAMAVIGGIGDMPDTIEDRAVVITLQRRAPGEKVTSWRSRRAIPALLELRERLHGWVLTRLDDLVDSEPDDLPVEDRAADCWEPLVAIADAAGGDWPERARKACQALSGATDEPDDSSAGERLLADIHTIWRGEHCLYTATLIDRLCAIEEAPWSTWHKDGKLISPRAFAGLLKPYRIKTRDVREAGTGPQRKGLYLDQLTDAWSRYLSRDSRDTATSEPAQPIFTDLGAVAVTPERSATPSATRSDADDSGVEDHPVAHVAAVAAVRLNRATCAADGCTNEPRNNLLTCYAHAMLELKLRDEKGVPL